MLIGARLTTAPAHPAPGDGALAGFRGQTVVLGFASSWAEAQPEKLPRLRAELRGLGAALFLISPHEAYAFSADDELELRMGSSEEDHQKLRWLMAAHGVEEQALAAGETVLVVVDGSGVTRWSQTSPTLEDPLGTLLAATSRAGAQLRAAPPNNNISLSRRELLVASLTVALAASLAACRRPDERKAKELTQPAAKGTHEREVTLKINGKTHTLKLEPRVSLLDTLRERLSLTGTKKGCDHGQCGACTVLVSGERVNACLLLSVMVEGAEITTIEGLADGNTLHPMQAAFVAEDGLQCGYCTPGQIVSAVALLKENRARTDAEVREHMSGNICRCGAYPNIVRAIQKARGGAPT
ncbi:MAG TPA: 2Fe-2S iron-sulfur cluster-binding protein [Polyangiaceae bacterium]|nr:2Fe-2S iron-sulfur cluster-binding protein [Polyangiaceae bacterium]